jgi:hypothetical protein
MSKETNHQWKEWETLVDRLQQLNPGIPAEKLVDKMEYVAKQLGNPLNNTDYTELAGEAIWHDLGRPYYKIYPAILDAMKNTNIEIDQQYVNLPYPAFEIKLPPGELRDTVGSVVLVIKTDAGGPGNYGISFRKHSLIDELEKTMGRYTGGISCFYKCPQDTAPTLSSITLFEGNTVENCIGVMLNTEAECETRLADETLVLLFKVICATALFGIHNHELVLPDVQRPVIQARPRGKKRGKAIPEKPPKHSGWTVGKEIKLPMPIYTNNGAKGTGRELSGAHLRSGHMRLQACGTQYKDRKLIFVAPTIIRPDLPMGTKHGYRITG